MGKMVGVHTGITGKIGAFIYQVNKGMQIIKTMAIPENPRTPSQVTVRVVFSDIVASFKNLATQWIRHLWNPFTIGNAQGWGDFIGANIDHMGTTFDGADAILSKGSLEGVADLAGTYDTATGAIEVTWDGTIFTNGLATDLFNFCVYDADTKQIILQGFSTDTRVDEASSIVGPTGLTADTLTLYACFANSAVATTPPTLISNSQLDRLQAPV